MRPRPTVLIWPAGAAALAEAVRAAGWPAADAAAPLGEPRVALVDARGDEAGALAALAAAAAAPVRLALLAAADAGAEDRLIDAGATQIAVVGGGDVRLGPALRLAALALAPRRAGPRPGAVALDRWLADRLGAGRPVTVVHVAIVRLDLVNAAHGRRAGTMLVREAGRRIAALAAAAAEETMVARVAGPGFAVAVAAGEAGPLADRLGEALARPYRVGGGAASLGVRVGIATARAGAAAALLDRAVDAAGAPAPALADDSLAVDVHHAAARGEVAILFQPQAAMAGGAPTGVEALVRWRHPGRGLLGAATLLEAAGRAGIATSLAEHIRHLVLAETAAWPAALAGLGVALNLTAADLARPGLVAALPARIDASGLTRDRLTIELTETEAMADPAAAAAALAGLRAAGCRTAIDDFGTGHSSLARLAALPIDYLKLDRSLAQAIEGDERGRAVVLAAIGLAHALGIAVVAEGVETEAQRAALAAAGCTLYQGFLLAPPLDTAALLRWMEDRR